MHLTMKKSDLVEELQKRRNEIWDAHHERITKIENALADVRDEQALREELAAWHEAVAEYIREGGQLTQTGQPPKRSGVGTRPDLSRSQVQLAGYHYPISLEDAKRELKHAQDQRADAVRNIDAALTLLNKATNDVVEIPAADYQRLLGSDRHPVRY